MIGFLRFVGLLNAAAWFGAALFLVVGADPAITSAEMQNLLGPRNFPYFSVAISEIVTARYAQLYLLFTLVALLHMTGEWLYLGKYPSRSWLGLVFALALAGIIQTFWLQPALRSSHRLRYSQTPQSQAAGHKFIYAQRASAAINLLTVAGLAIYFWRFAYPSDSSRFVSTSKFRS